MKQNKKVLTTYHFVQQHSAVIRNRLCSQVSETSFWGIFFTTDLTNCKRLQFYLRHKISNYDAGVESAASDHGICHQSISLFCWRSWNSVQGSVFEKGQSLWIQDSICQSEVQLHAKSERDVFTGWENMLICVVGETPVNFIQGSVSAWKLDNINNKSIKFWILY